VSACVGTSASHDSFFENDGDGEEFSTLDESQFHINNTSNSIKALQKWKE